MDIEEIGFEGVSRIHVLLDMNPAHTLKTNY